MKAVKIIVALLCVAFLCSCQGLYLNNEGQDGDVPQLQATNPTNSSVSSAALYFGFSDQNLLAAEFRRIDTYPNNSYEYALLSALLRGPQGVSSALSSVIDQSTTLESISFEGNCIFVTLSDDFILLEQTENQSEEEFAIQCLRQRMAVYSVVNTLIENTGYSRVQLYIVRKDQNVTERPSRGELGFYGDGRESEHIEPLAMDESYIMTPCTALKAFSSCLIKGNLEDAYKYLSSDSATGILRPDLAGFEADYNQNGQMMVSAEVSEFYSVSEDGSRARGMISYILTSDTGERIYEDIPVSFIRSSGIWRISYSFMLDVFGGEE